MFFENLFLLSDKPSFTRVVIRDKNVLSGVKKFRTIYVPNKSMKIVHKFFIRYLRCLKEGISDSDGTRKGSSIIKNILKHRFNRYFYAVDIQRAYPSINGERLTEILYKLDPELNPKRIREFLKTMCLTSKNGLITGAPASPDLFNIYVSIVLDGTLKNIAQKYKLTYTRYRDDLLFSSTAPIGKRKRKAICSVIRTAGFTPHPQKTRLYDLKQKPAVINGIRLEFGGRIFVPRHFLRKAYGLIHRAITKGDITQEKIEGTMGAFWGATDRTAELNKTEQKLVKKYQALMAR
jgi:hypothetical protein